MFPHAEPGTFMLAVNNYAGQPNAALKDKRVRQAMSLVLDRKKMADIGFFGIAEPACAYAFKPGNPYFQCSLPNDGRRTSPPPRRSWRRRSGPRASSSR